MIVITGGAGFIGSALAWRLNQKGVTDLLLVDHLAESEKWKNLVPLRFVEYLDRQEFIAGSNTAISGTRSMRSSTSAHAHRQLRGTRITSSKITTGIRCGSLRGANATRMPFDYASSAATYGDGSCGYLDNEEDMA